MNEPIKELAQQLLDELGLDKGYAFVVVDTPYPGRSIFTVYYQNIVQLAPDRKITEFHGFPVIFKASNTIPFSIQVAK